MVAQRGVPVGAGVGGRGFGDDTAVDDELRTAVEEAFETESGATDGPAGPHPIPQYEIHYLKSALGGVTALIERSGLRALIHPLTLDDLADHTSLAHWIGAPVALDTTVLDPPGVNQGIPRFGKADF